MGRYKHLYLSDKSIEILDEIFDNNNKASSQFLSYQCERIIKALSDKKEISITIDLTKIK